MISVSQLHFKYGTKRIYDDFSLRLDEPGVVGLFGRNGSGKSTLLKILAGLLFPDSGAVEVLGHQPQRRLPDFLRQVVIVPEEFHLPNIRVAALSRYHAPFYPDFSAADFARYVNVFDIPVNQAFDEMSLGQKKKAVIAFALATHTPILLMDEPTNGLDIISRTQFKQVMAGAEQRNRLVIISTHQAHDLESLMNHVLFVDAGRIALSASTSTLSCALQVGVSDQPVGHSLYQEQLGSQWAYVEARSTPASADAVNHISLELLYKALSTNKQGVLDAIRLAGKPEMALP